MNLAPIMTKVMEEDDNNTLTQNEPCVFCKGSATVFQHYADCTFGEQVHVH